MSFSSTILIGAPPDIFQFPYHFPNLHPRLSPKYNGMYLMFYLHLLSTSVPSLYQLIVAAVWLLNIQPQLRSLKQDNHLFSEM